MRTLTLLPVAASLTMLSGCAAWIVFGHAIQGDPSAAAAPAGPAAPLLKAVTVTFTPAAQQKVAAEPHFNQATLLTPIEAELRAHKLLDRLTPYDLAGASSRGF